MLARGWRYMAGYAVLLALGVTGFMKLPVGFLRSQESPEQYLRKVAGQANTYGGFNLLVGNRDALWEAF